MKKLLLGIAFVTATTLTAQATPNDGSDQSILADMKQFVGTNDISKLRALCSKLEMLPDTAKKRLGALLKGEPTDEVQKQIKKIATDDVLVERCILRINSAMAAPAAAPAMDVPDGRILAAMQDFLNRNDINGLCVKLKTLPDGAQKRLGNLLHGEPTGPEQTKMKELIDNNLTLGGCILEMNPEKSRYQW